MLARTRQQASTANSASRAGSGRAELAPMRASPVSSATVTPRLDWPLPNDDSLAHLGKVTTERAECHEGSERVRCDHMRSRLPGLPSDCQPCPLRSGRCACTPAATMDASARQDNVEGERCDKCKPGFFLLDRDNPKGCMECYCSGVSSQCEPASGYKLQEVTLILI
ncbi:hypothetical protein LSTR_LSTR015528 [Laodelphax striatellus]|uniref:Laminin EGF-like domain-containing protein n=1 Tax=Laodelphax striatellus TaxID=195883 RepID=A0A482XED5_LAOST|nr:hypothetical protein LSTR_LSTR015528 [Laodelphax striatellus]